MGSAEGEGARKRGRERGGAVNEGDGGRPSRRRNLPVPEKCHSLFGYDQFSGTGKFRLWLGHPIAVHCPPRSRPVCVCPPRVTSWTVLLNFSNVYRLFLIRLIVSTALSQVTHLLYCLVTWHDSTHCM